VSRISPTPEQAAAIAARGANVLLEAGAGTGKTGVMVERYCRLVCEEGVAPEAILAFTFTERAASELRQRIRAELARRAGEGSARAAALLGEIGSAWVTTIHGFCNRVLAAHPVAAGIDPGVRVLDAPEASRAAREAFDEALREFVAAGGREREDLLAAYDAEGLRAMVVGAYEELRSRGVARPRLPEPPTPDPGAALARAAAAAAEALEECRDDRNRELLERAARLDDGPPPTLDEVAALRTDSKARALSRYREEIEAATARCAEAAEGGAAYRGVAELLELFGERYERVKERRAGVDFEDLQILAARLLEREEIGGAYRRRFRHLLVDEFQDTNRLQLRLIEALRDAETELVVVGDELQSIYGFRHADLDVFRERRRLAADEPGSRLMALSGNFRSRPEVIGAVNLLGRALLGDAYRPLRVGAPPPAEPPPGDGPPVELLLTARDGWDAEEIDLDPATDSRTPLNCLAEARFVAARLRELADAGAPRGGMVVLLRAFTNLDAYEDALERAGLRPYVVGGRGYWSQQQVADVRALLATIANPLDDEALFGALASPACGAAPDTLWLLRAAAGRRRPVWPALERAAGLGEPELEDPGRLEAIPDAERELLREFGTTLAGLRERAPRLGLEALIEAACTETGYDLAVLMRPAGEARWANVRKLMRLAAEYEGREGRDLRGLLDFLEARSEGAEPQAATAVEGHDGVRIMTIHAAKGLEFDVVAVPGLSRSLLGGGSPPALLLGREQRPRVGMRLRRLGGAPIDLYELDALREEQAEREVEEELRLFHVAATRARQRLILSGVVNPKPGNGSASTPIVERLVGALGIERDADGEVEVPAPEPRPGLEARFEASRIAVRVNLPSPERAARLRAARREGGDERPLGEGPPPLVRRRPPVVPTRSLSYTAISAYEECGYRFYAERVLELPRAGGGPVADDGPDGGAAGSPGGRARGAVVHALLEWSCAHGWREPPPELARAHAEAAGLDDVAALLEPVRGWLESTLLRERVREAERVRAEVPILLGVGGAVLRGSIDLLAKGAGAPPLIVDYKTDRLRGEPPAERVEHYANQRDIYALAVAEALGAPRVEVAYVFLERPDEPALATLDGPSLAAARDRLAAAVERINSGSFPPAPVERRTHALCAECPARGRLCSGPARL